MFRLSILLVALTLAASAPGQSAPANSPARFRITGTVVNAVTGQSLSKIEVSIGWAEGSGPVRTVTTSPDGRFSFGDLAPKKYWLAAQGRGFSIQRFDQHAEFSTAIAVGANKDSEDLVFRIYPDATVVGTITDEEGDPVAGAQVMLFRTGVHNGESSTRLRSQTMTDDQGHYDLPHVPEGTYYIAVSARPWYAENDPFRALSLRGEQVTGQTTSVSSAETTQQSQFDVTYPVTFYAGVTDPAAATPVTIKPGDRLLADFSLAAIPALHLQISDSNLAALPTRRGFRPEPFSVNLNQRVFGVTVPTSASFQMLAPGKVELNGVPPGDFTLTVQTFGKNPTSREKQIGIMDNSEVDVADASGLASIRGVVEPDGGRPLPHAIVVELANSSGDGFSMQTSQNGEFQLSGVRPGKYEVSASGSEDVFLKSISTTGANMVGREIDIAADAAIQLKMVLSEGTGRINGTALRDGQPWAGAMIVLVPQDIGHNAPLVRRDQSDSDGTFSLYHVLPGMYTLVAIQNGWDLEWLSPEILQPYLKFGEVVNVVANGKYDMKVDVK
jgi:Carboxypeptidase regulatory-like domain